MELESAELPELSTSGLQETQGTEEYVEGLWGMQGEPVGNSAGALLEGPPWASSIRITWKFRNKNTQVQLQNY